MLCFSKLEKNLYSVGGGQPSLSRIFERLSINLFRSELERFNNVVSLGKISYDLVEAS